jgi:esterase/lipase superfamily enzyme
VSPIVALALASCGSHGELAFAPEAARVGTVETVLVSTTRAPTVGLPLFGSERSETQHFARFDVWVPPQREMGSVTFPEGSAPDPATDFVVVSASRLTDVSAFTRAIDRELVEVAPGDRPAWLFVHWYNTNFAEGLYRQAQLQYDMERPWASIHFSWPSAAQTRYYGYDRESAMYSREALIATLDAMARSQATEFNLVAHSMGNALLMDALWIMAQSGHAEAFRKINLVVLMSPDMSVDIFRQQAPRVIARGVPVFIVVSESDRALRVSARLRGQQDRLGSIRSQAELGGLDVGVLDLSSIESGDSLGHFKAGTSPEVIAFVRAPHESGQEVFEGRQPGLLESGASLIQQGADVVIEPLATR